MVEGNPPPRAAGQVFLAFFAEGFLDQRLRGADFRFEPLGVEGARIEIARP